MSPQEPLSVLDVDQRATQLVGAREIGGRRGSGRSGRLARRFLARLAQIASVTVLVIVITFVLIHVVPGDPARMLLGRAASPEALAALRARLGTDLPLTQQFWNMVVGLSRGDLGTSLVSQSQSVTSIVVPAFANTLTLVATAVAFSLVIGLTLGLICGLNRGGRIDLVLSNTMVLLLACPGFLVGFLLLLFALKTELAPAGGWGNGPLSFRYVWLPSLALAAGLSPIIARALRVSIHQTMSQDFIEGAISRGLRHSTLVVKHVVPNSLLPLIGVVGYSVSGLLAGAAAVEIVFNVPGIGLAMMFAVQNRDFPVIQGIVLITALTVISFNVVVDLLFVIVDPRTRKS